MSHENVQLFVSSMRVRRNVLNKFHAAELVIDFNGQSTPEADNTLLLCWLMESSHPCGSPDGTSSIVRSRSFVCPQQGVMTVNTDSLASDLSKSLRLCVSSGAEYTSLNVRVVKMKVVPESVTQTTAAWQNLTLSWSGIGLENDDIIWFQASQIDCNIPSGISTTSSTGYMPVFGTNINSFTARLNWKNIRSESTTLAMRLCMLRSSTQLTFDISHVRVNLLVDPNTTVPPTVAIDPPSESPTTSSTRSPTLSPSPSPVVAETFQSFSVFRKEGYHSLRWRKSAGVLTPGDQLGLIPVDSGAMLESEEECSGNLQPFHQFHADVANGTNQEDDVQSGGFLPSLLYPGRYILCYCQGNGKICGRDNPGAWKSFVGYLLVLDVPDLDQQIVVRANKASSSKVFFTNPGSPFNTDRFYLVPTDKPCGYFGNDQILAVVAESSSSAEYIDGVRAYPVAFSSTWEMMPGVSFSVCFCNSTTEPGRECPIPLSSSAWSLSYGGPVATLFVHDISFASLPKPTSNQPSWFVVALNYTSSLSASDQV